MALDWLEGVPGVGRGSVGRLWRCFGPSSRSQWCCVLLVLAALAGVGFNTGLPSTASRRFQRGPSSATETNMKHAHPHPRCCWRPPACSVAAVRRRWGKEHLANVTADRQTPRRPIYTTVQPCLALASVRALPAFPVSVSQQGSGSRALSPPSQPVLVANDSDRQTPP